MSSEDIRGVKTTKLLYFSLAALLAACALPQETSEAGLKATVKYRAYRETETEPPFGLAEVKRLVSHIKPDKDGNDVLAAKTFNALSTSEKFTYTMLHGEVSSQNCDIMPAFAGMEKVIFPFPEPAFGEGNEDWSDRQTAFLEKNHSKVVAMLRTTIRDRHRVGANLKKAILEEHIYQVIPDIITVYNADHKDQDILSLLMVLMKEGNYKPFLASPIYKKLYGGEDSYQSHVTATPQNRKTIETLAMAYYRSKKG